MPWQDQLKGDPLPWLLEKGSPGVRYLALRDVRELPESDRELRAARKAAHKEGPIAAVLAEMGPAGFWVEPGPGYNPKYRSTVWAIILLAELGASIAEDKRIATACAYLLDHALTPGGQFTGSGAPSGTVDCLQGNLCWALAELGCRDPRLEKAFEWMARTVTGEGIAPLADKQAAVRYYAGKCGPGFACGANNKLPCAWGAAKVMLAFGQLTGPAANAADPASHRARHWLSPEHRSRHGRISQRLHRQAQPELVEVRFPGLLRHGRAADRRSARRAWATAAIPGWRMRWP